MIEQPRTPGPGDGDEDDEDFDGEEEAGVSFHEMPTFGREHAPCWDCWCGPEAEWRGDVPVWVHKTHH